MKQLPQKLTEPSYRGSIPLLLFHYSAGFMGQLLLQTNARRNADTSENKRMPQISFTMERSLQPGFLEGEVVLQAANILSTLIDSSGPSKHRPPAIALMVAASSKFSQLNNYRLDNSRSNFSNQPIFIQKLVHTISQESRQQIKTGMITLVNSIVKAVGEWLRELSVAGLK